MLTGLNSTGYTFVTNINDIQSRLTKVQQQLSSGVAVSDASDAPDQVSALLQLHVDIQQNATVQQSLTSAKGELNTADTAMSTALTIMDSAQTLAAEGMSYTQTPATRSTLSDQVSDLMQQMVGLTQTRVSGRYIFSGDADQSPSYQFNPASPSGVDRLQVSTGTRQISDGSGGAIAVSRSANDIFDQRDASDKPTGNNVFAALNNLRVALASNDTAGIQAGQAALQTAATYLNQQQGFYGAAQNHVNAALSNASDSELALQTDLSNRQDVDETAAIMKMQQYITNLQAAVSSQAKMPQTTLFDMLNR
jgi:flagellar hook-associated protein 3 FlgL